jgi:riboflavin transporter FmnP
MNSKTLTIIAVFAALAIVLSISPLKFPAPYAPFLKYQVWEIAIVTALLLYGIKVGVSISFINALVLLVVFPGDLPTGPIYNLIAVLSMLVGISIVQRVVGKRVSRGRWVILAALSTVSGIITRVTVMSIVNWIVLRYPPPFGYSVPLEELPTMLSIVALFNATIVLYTIPIGYIIARAVGIGTKTKTWNQTALDS